MKKWLIFTFLKVGEITVFYLIIWEIPFRIGYFFRSWSDATLFDYWLNGWMFIALSSLFLIALYWVFPLMKWLIKTNLNWANKITKEKRK